MKKSLNSNRIILGITAFNHDSSACILKDDKLVAFAEEERFNGLKHTNTFPSQAIKYCLSEAGVQSKDVTDIAFYFNVRECWSSYFKTNNFFNYLADPSLFLRKRYIYELLWLLDFSLKVKTIPKLLMNNKVRVHYVNHHMAHTWYGFYASNVDEAVVVSNDSVGESTSTLVSQFKRDANGYIHSNVLTSQKDPNSLGYLYGAVTDYLGFKRGEGEGRVMALASFGRPRFQAFFLDRIVLLPKGKFKIQKSLLQQRSFQPRGRRLSKIFYNTFGRARVADSQLTQKH